MTADPDTVEPTNEVVVAASEGGLAKIILGEQQRAQTTHVAAPAILEVQIQRQMSLTGNQSRVTHDLPAIVAQPTENADAYPVR